MVAFTLTGLLAASNSTAVLLGMGAATRIFNGHYAVNLTATETTKKGGSDIVLMKDFVDSQTANVYRIGCDSASFLPTPQRENNFAVAGSFESDVVVVDTPGRFSTGLTACVDSVMMDDRCRVNADTADPFDGRWAAKVNLGSSSPVSIPIALNQSLATHRGFLLQFAYRSSPPGIAVDVLFSQGNSTRNLTTATAGVEWQQVKAHFTTADAAVAAAVATPLHVQLRSHIKSGGAVWLDAIAVSAV